MNKFIEGIKNTTYTENGMPVYKSSKNACLDLFYLVNASRERTEEEIINLFAKAYIEDPKLAVSIALYCRDIREGQGERRAFRAMLKCLMQVLGDFSDIREALLSAITEVGRWDDLKVLTQSNDSEWINLASTYWANAINDGNFLAAKWAPSTSKKGAAPIRKKLGFRLDKEWRKYLSEIAKKRTIENVVCNTKDYKSVNYSHLPSNAMNRWKSNFYKHDLEHFQEYLSDLTKGTQGVKVNAATLYPYNITAEMMPLWNDFLSGGSVSRRFANVSPEIIALKEAQWKALPNYANTQENILVVVDHSSSMTWHDVAKGVKPIHVADALALYISERNTGDFKNIVMAFADSSQMAHLSGDTLLKRYQELNQLQVGYSTSLESIFDSLLGYANRNDIPPEDMPTKILIISDMEFNQCVHDKHNRPMDVAKKGYESAGYKLPQIVFWNVQARADRLPTTSDQKGVALVSGCSPVIMKSILRDSFDPISVMMQTVDKDRYHLATYMPS